MTSAGAMSFVEPFVAAFTASLTGWGIVLAILTAVELANPHERHSLAGRASGVAYWGLLTLSGAALATGMQLAWAALGLAPIVTLPVLRAVSWAGWLAVPVAVIAGALFHDFVFYWFHRAQHRWLWRWHAVHHSIEELNAVNSYHHLSEGLFSLVLVTIPTTLIVADTGPAVPIATLLIWLHVVWIHSPTRLHAGPLRCVLADNRFHRIHHSLEARHFDKNFGAFTTLWDRLFGTCHMPAPGEWPAVGLAEVRQPTTLADWWTLPARYRAATQPLARPATPAEAASHTVPAHSLPA
ncbi:sterol desaturase family protein [Sphingomonas sp. 179-A 2A2 NHS]|uniref:sterol desaturase family protein n=1 Tax=Sphingomonas sp. 179-A 2A2 NHS TaxID=3374290 RepID=UPI00387916C3